ncbi:hypothetical protein BdWA1_000875 [Babesia duncani]|uniref:Uncharacterized protein n=1 Tax=Babesia duncani TaxID=323732 RepID=A0AAD9PN37_9APIC|nr:hypothetical protein BdWA1_000875 [Babesia duncani]
MTSEGKDNKRCNMLDLVSNCLDAQSYVPKHWRELHKPSPSPKPPPKGTRALISNLLDERLFIETNRFKQELKGTFCALLIHPLEMCEPIGLDIDGRFQHAKVQQNPSCNARLSRLVEDIEGRDHRLYRMHAQKVAQQIGPSSVVPPQSAPTGRHSPPPGARAIAVRLNCTQTQPSPSHSEALDGVDSIREFPSGRSSIQSEVLDGVDSIREFPSGRSSIQSEVLEGVESIREFPSGRSSIQSEVLDGVDSIREFPSGRSSIQSEVLEGVESIREFPSGRSSIESEVLDGVDSVESEGGRPLEDLDGVESIREFPSGRSSIKSEAAEPLDVLAEADEPVDIVDGVDSVESEADEPLEVLAEADEPVDIVDDVDSIQSEAADPVDSVESEDDEPVDVLDGVDSVESQGDEPLEVLEGVDSIQSEADEPLDVLAEAAEPVDVLAETGEPVEVLDGVESILEFPSGRSSMKSEVLEGVDSVESEADEPLEVLAEADEPVDIVDDVDSIKSEADEPLEVLAEADEPVDIVDDVDSIQSEAADPVDSVESEDDEPVDVLDGVDSVESQGDEPLDIVDDVDSVESEDGRPLEVLAEAGEPVDIVDDVDSIQSEAADPVDSVESEDDEPVDVLDGVDSVESQGGRPLEALAPFSSRRSSIRLEVDGGKSPRTQSPPSACSSVRLEVGEPLPLQSRQASSASEVSRVAPEAGADVQTTVSSIDSYEIEGDANIMEADTTAQSLQVMYGQEYNSSTSSGAYSVEDKDLEASPRSVASGDAVRADDEPIVDDVVACTVKGAQEEMQQEQQQLLQQQQEEQQESTYVIESLASYVIGAGHPAQDPDAAANEVEALSAIQSAASFGFNRLFQSLQSASDAAVQAATAALDAVQGDKTEDKEAEPIQPVAPFEAPGLGATLSADSGGDTCTSNQSQYSCRELDQGMAEMYSEYVMESDSPMAEAHLECHSHATQLLREAASGSLALPLDPAEPLEPHDVEELIGSPEGSMSPRDEDEFSELEVDARDGSSDENDSTKDWRGTTGDPQLSSEPGSTSSEEDSRDSSSDRASQMASDRELISNFSDSGSGSETPRATKELQADAGNLEGQGSYTETVSWFFNGMF